MTASFPLPTFFPLPALLPSLQRLYRIDRIKACALLSLAVLLLCGATRPASAQITQWNCTRCNPDGSVPYVDPPSHPSPDPITLHGPISIVSNYRYPFLQNNPSLLNDYVICDELNFGEGPGDLQVTNNPDSYLHGILTADVSGQLRAYFRWTAPLGMWFDPNGNFEFGPITPAQPPPPYMNILVQSGVGLSAGSYSDFPVDPAQLSASVTVADSFGESLSYPCPLSPLTHSTAVGGSHLLRVPVSNNGSGVAVVEVDGTAQVREAATAALTFTDPDTGEVQTNNAAVWCGYGVSATAVQDTREVTISCPAIETSYYKGVIDDLHPTGQWPHLRDASGSLETDSVAVPGTADNDTGAWLGNATFSANTAGFTNPTYAWSSDFGPVQMIGVDLTQQSVAGSWFLFTADKLPSVKHVHVSVQDGPNTDHATTANDYVVTWHLPEEVVNTTPFDTECGKYSLQPARLGPIPDGETDLLLPMPSQKIDWGAAIDGTSLIAGAAGQEEVAAGLEIVGAVAKTLSWETDVDPEPQIMNGATNDSTTWSDALNDNQEIYGGTNIPSGLLNDPNGWQLCNLYIFEVVHYTDNSWYADGYNANGYDGNSKHVVFIHQIDAVYDEPQFIQYKNRDGTPYNPPQ